MARRIAKNKILVMRDKKQVEVLPKESFDFTADEIKELDALGALVPNVKNETPAKSGKDKADGVE